MYWIQRKETNLVVVEKRKPAPTLSLTSLTDPQIEERKRRRNCEFDGENVKTFISMNGLLNSALPSMGT